MSPGRGSRILALQCSHPGKSDVVPVEDRSEKRLPSPLSLSQTRGGQRWAFMTLPGLMALTSLTHQRETCTPASGPRHTPGTLDSGGLGFLYLQRDRKSGGGLEVAPWTGLAIIPPSRWEGLRGEEAPSWAFRMSRIQRGGERKKDIPGPRQGKSKQKPGGSVSRPAWLPGQTGREQVVIH